VFWRRDEPPVTREDVTAMMVTLMTINAKLDRALELLGDEDGEEEGDA
jgi:hypothetical protein